MPGIIENFITELKKIGRGLTKLRFFQFKHFARFFEVIGVRERLAVALLILLLASDLGIIAWKFYVRHTIIVAANGSEYIEGMIGTPRVINPILAQTQTDRDLSTLTYAGLYKLDAKGIMIPDLAQSLPLISADNKHYTIALKPNLHWIDGQTIKSDDIIFTIQTIQNPEVKSPLQKIWANITLQRIDDSTLMLTNKTVSAPFISNLTVGILPQHIWSNIKPANISLSEYNLQPIGSGPYFVKEINKLQSGEITSVALESYSNYWQGKAYVDRVTVRFYNNYQDVLFALHSNEISGFGFIPFDQKIYIDSKTNLTVRRLPLLQYQALFFNPAKSPKVLGDQIVRNALARSVDRDSLIQHVYFGFALPAFGPIMPEQLGYNPAVEKINAYDLSAANHILDAEGWIPGTDGLRAKGNLKLEFTISTNDYILNIKSAEQLRDQWVKIGAKVNINVQPTNDLERNSIRPRNYESLLFAESTGSDPDPFVFWHSSQSLDPGFNLSQYKNPTVDRLISDGRNTFDNNVRIQKYQQFQELIATDLPAIFLDQSEFIYVTAPDLKGVTLGALANPQDRFYDVVHWFLQTKRVWKR